MAQLWDTAMKHGQNCVHHCIEPIGKEANCPLKTPVPSFLETKHSCMQTDAPGVLLQFKL